eukprot:GDKI01001874.1.p1 GENE.GDKI01001874.1~~GDKI01001874.1.p1  ORF type:complete len:226 (+),score=46.20 GDKI01001874.1:385-1062(+)
MLVYLGMNKAAQESIGETFDKDLIEMNNNSENIIHTPEGTIKRTQINAIDHNTKIFSSKNTELPSPNFFIYMGAHVFTQSIFKNGDTAEMRFRFQTPVGVLPGDGDQYPSIGVSFLPDPADYRSWLFPNSDCAHTYIYADEINKAVGRSVWEDCVFRVCVHTSGSVCVVLESGWGAGREGRELILPLSPLPSNLGAGVFRLCVSLCEQGPFVSILPPRGARVIEV